jgi:hypothetical protein
MQKIQSRIFKLQNFKFNNFFLYHSLLKSSKKLNFSNSFYGFNLPEGTTMFRLLVSKIIDFTVF